MKILFCRKCLTDSRNRGILYESHRGVAQFGRALRSGRRGRKFESCHLDHRKCTQFREAFRGCVFCFIWESLKFVRHLCAAISKGHEKAGQNITRNRRRSYSTSGRFLFYACSLSFHAMLCKKLCVIQKSRRRIISHPTTAFLCILGLSKIS